MTEHRMRAATGAAAWRRRYAMRLRLTDAAAVVTAVGGAQLIWPGTRSGHLAGIAFVSYATVSLVLVAGWLILLRLFGTRSPKVVGYGAEEFALVVRATLVLFGAVAIVSFLASAEVSRGYILLAFPAGLVLLLAGRGLWRVRLRVERRGGGMTSRVVLVTGDCGEDDRLLTALRATPEAGLQVVAVCTPHPLPRGDAGGLPRFDGREGLRAALKATAADTVLVSDDAALPADDVRRLSWLLETGRQELIVAPSLTDVAGPRIHTRPVTGLALVHVETPRYTGWQAAMKRAFDLVVATGLLVLLAPVFAVVALLVKAGSRGPVFYTQTRVGRGGVPFEMVKFRSMVVGADDRLSELLAQQGTADQPLFKLHDDPRVTPIGHVLRKYSLDELPQLFNVLRGTMSLVGPRPQRDAEVALYDDDARRRLYVKPGMSGLWQVSGRSALCWEEALRLDLFYVENWSLTGDLSILFRTFRAVVAPGATAR